MTHKNTPTDGFKAAEAALDKRVLAALAAAWKMAADRGLIIDTGYFTRERVNDVLEVVTTPEDDTTLDSVMKTASNMATADKELYQMSGTPPRAPEVIAFDAIDIVLGTERSAA